MGLSGEYRTTRENMGQRREMLDREGKYSIEAEEYWTETGNMRKKREIWVGEGKIMNRDEKLDKDGKYWVTRGNIG